MAISWNSGVNHPITLEQARRAATATFHELLRLPDGTYEVQVRTRTADSRFGEPVPPEVLDLLRDPFDDPQPAEADVLFAVPDLDAGTFVRVAELFPREEGEEESGLHAYINSWRTNASQVLSIATVIGFAAVGDGQVVDEGKLLDGPIVSAPGDLLERMRSPGAEPDVPAAVDQVLRKTRLRRDY